MRIKIGIKIFITLLIFFVEILAFMFAFSIINRHHEHIIHNQLQETEELDLIRNLQIALAQVVMPVNDFLIVGGAPDEDKNFRVLSAKVEKIIAELDNVTFDDAKERELMSHIKREYSQLKNVATEIFSISGAAGNIEAGKLMEEMDALADDALRDAEEFRVFVHQEIEKINIDMRRIKDTIDAIIRIGFLLNILLLFGILFYFRRTLILPIGYIRNVALEIGKGNLERKISIKNRDEIGDLAGSFNKMTDDLKRLIQKERGLALAAALARDAAKKKAAELQEAYKQLRETHDQLIQSEKMSVLGQLASGVAHEIRNPLAVITQGLDYLKAKLVSLMQIDLSEVFRMMEDSVQRADNIVRTLLDFSRSTKVDMKSEDLNVLIETSLSLVQYHLKKGNVEIIKQLKDRLPKIMADKRKLEQVFINIFLNAIQAIPDTGKITIRTYDVQLKEMKNSIEGKTLDYFNPEEKVVIVEVEDTGTGIPEKDLKKIFTPFFTTKGPGLGTGLGLSVTNNIINLHKGLINVESCVGKGTKVTIIFNGVGKYKTFLTTETS